MKHKYVYEKKYFYFFTDCISGFWIPPFRGFNHSDFQQRTSDQVKVRDETVEEAPTPFTALWDHLWQRIRTPFKQLPKEVKKARDVKTGNLSFGENDKRNKEIGNIKSGNDVYLTKGEEEAVKITKLHMNSSLVKINKRSNENESIPTVKGVFLKNESEAANITFINVNDSFHSMIDNNAGE